MAGNRGLVGLLALAVLVWGVAFGGGLTVAVLTSSVNVTATFETTDGLTAIDESIGSDPAAATVPVGNGTGDAEGLENVTVPPENVSLPSDEPVTNGSVTPKNETVPPENASEPTENAPESSENAVTPPTDEGAPTTNESAHTGNTAAESASAFRGSIPESMTPDARRSMTSPTRSAGEA
ncbi:hypothetical protein [Halorubrum lacusprofundi]|jgi:hypothetical protein|uniref:Uncharacterized protein n=1 Tax=Halorubrum lacusprofundi (strain ATCC 49239 / DSM 5036 / JCM 8891 / ACAM 34) TaxID=416348 RepID=B9LQY3_HALLT|nr:hypothetical protein [Halorubrum lacusprofundi]ACM55735.1 hypothetical protein Hlac_0129 [Halorubrum lacusprofundi ATCC 49239]